MTHYIVRHKDTGKVLPQLPGRGYSGWHPVHADPNQVWEDALTPRLFGTERGAHKFIEQWAKGIAYAHTEQDDYSGGTVKTGYVEYETVTGRTRDQLEVVPVELQYGEAL